MDSVNFPEAIYLSSFGLSDFPEKRCGNCDKTFDPWDAVFHGEGECPMSMSNRIRKAIIKEEDDALMAALLAYQVGYAHVHVS